MALNAAALAFADVRAAVEVFRRLGMRHVGAMISQTLNDKDTHATLPFVACEQVHACLAVSDIPATGAFYVEKLGFKLAFTWGDPPTFAGERGRTRASGRIHKRRFATLRN